MFITQKRFSSPRHRGYSLLEIMVVVGITAVLLAMAATRYRSWQSKSEFNGETERFQDQVKLMATLAQAAGQCLTESGVAPLSNNVYTKSASDLGASITQVRWIAYKNNDKVNSGTIGSKQNIKMFVSSDYKTASKTKMRYGAWIDIIGTSRIDGGAGSVLARVIFRPDGTPQSPGRITIQSIGSDNKIEKQVNVILKKLGGIDYTLGNNFPN